MSADPIDLSPRIPHQILTSLLNKPRYRAKWMPYVQRRRGNTINQRAVAAFIAGELSDALDQEISPQRFKDRISRALKGEAISDTTAQLFISTFEFTQQEAQELQRALSSYKMNLQVAQRSTVASATKVPATGRGPYRSLSTFLEGKVDRFGYLHGATITEVIQAETETVEQIFQNFESASIQCTMLEGGELVEVYPSDSMTPHANDNSVHRLVIRPPHPIRRGQIHQVRYHLTLDRKAMIESNDTENTITFGPFSPPRFNISLRLEFEEAPHKIKQLFWDRKMTDANLWEAQDLEIRKTYSAYFPLIEDTIYSLEWSCDAQAARQAYEMGS